MSSRGKSHLVLRSVGLGIFRGLLPHREVERIALQALPRLRQRALTVGVVFGLLTVAQLQRGITAVSSLLRHTWSRVRHRYGLSHVSAPVTRQAFSKRLKTLPWEIFRDLLRVLLGSLSDLVNPGPSLFHGLFTVQAIDRTVVDVAARLISVWKGKKGSGFAPGKKSQVGLDTMYDVTLGVPRVVVIDGARGRELESARKIIQKGLYGPRVIYVLDRGYVSFALFRHILREESFFVIRVHRRAKYIRLRRLGFKDCLVRVGISAPSQPQVDLRRVGIEEGGKTFWYFTNLMPEHGIRPQDVRVLYRMRWQVELFFRTLKCRMNATKFFSFHPNGVRLQIYVALCAHVLVRTLMAQSANLHQIPLAMLSFEKALTTTQCWMWEHWEHLWTPRPRMRYLRELLDLIPLHCLIVRKRQSRRKKGAA